MRSMDPFTSYPRPSRRWDSRAEQGADLGPDFGPDTSRGGRGRRGHRQHDAAVGFGHGGDGGRGGPRRTERGRGYGPGGESPGFGPFGAGGPGFGPGGPGRGGGRGRRARRGDVRHAVLALLADGPSNGYGLLKSIEERTGGVWRTSPGSVYPTLAQLADEGLIAPVETAGSGTDYELTEAGRTYTAEHAEELAAVWEPASQRWAEHGALMTATRGALAALQQIQHTGTSAQREAATTKVDELRRELYRILAD